jgi:hypothetical protein
MEPTIQELRQEMLADDYRKEMTASDMAEAIQRHIDAIEAVNYGLTGEITKIMAHPEEYFRIENGRIVKR